MLCPDKMEDEQSRSFSKQEGLVTMSLGWLIRRFRSEEKLLIHETKEHTAAALTPPPLSCLVRRFVSLGAFP